MDSDFLIKIVHAAEQAAQTEATSGGTIGTLGINLKLFIAQLINFGVILLILWKWVFGPVSKLLEERNQKIHRSLLEAKRVEEEKQNFEQWKNTELVETRHKASTIINQAQKDALLVKDQLLAEAKREQEKMIQEVKKQITSDKDKAIAEIKTQIADIVEESLKKIFKDQMNQKVDREYILDQLKNIK